MITVIIDTNVLVALVDGRDKWHTTATALRDALLDTGAQVVYFDCVLNEAIGVIGRRTEEQRRSDQFGRLLDGLSALAPERFITWIAAAGQRLFPQVLDLCREHGGRLNFHNALMALAGQEMGIPFIASFDTKGLKPRVRCIIQLQNKGAGAGRQLRGGHKRYVRVQKLGSIISKTSPPPAAVFRTQNGNVLNSELRKLPIPLRPRRAPRSN